MTTPEDTELSSMMTEIQKYWVAASGEPELDEILRQLQHGTFVSDGEEPMLTNSRWIALQAITLHTQKAVIAELKKVERLTRPMLPNSGDPIINIRMWASTRIEQLTNPTERSE